jgi:nucleoporin GLE1
VPNSDFDGRPWTDDAERAKMQGFRKSVEQDVLIEPTVEYMNRVAGNMRLYFHILKIPPQTRPMHPLFQLPRCWMWFARIMGDHALLGTPVAAQLIYSA